MDEYVSRQSEMQKHLLHNILDATIEVEKLTKREVTLTVCYLPFAAIYLTGPFAPLLSQMV